MYPRLIKCWFVKHWIKYSHLLTPPTPTPIKQPHGFHHYIFFGVKQMLIFFLFFIFIFRWVYGYRLTTLLLLYMIRDEREEKLICKAHIHTLTCKTMFNNFILLHYIYICVHIAEGGERNVKESFVFFIVYTPWVYVCVYTYGDRIYIHYLTCAISIPYIYTYTFNIPYTPFVLWFLVFVMVFGEKMYIRTYVSVYGIPEGTVNVCGSHTLRTYIYMHDNPTNAQIYIIEILDT